MSRALFAFNVYIVSYSEKSVEEVERELSRLSRIVSKARSSVVSSFYYYKILCSDEDSVKKLLDDLVSRGSISWAKIERTLG